MEAEKQTFVETNNNIEEKVSSFRYELIVAYARKI
jgi:hypothetical protein